MMTCWSTMVVRSSKTSDRRFEEATSPPSTPSSPAESPSLPWLDSMAADSSISFRAFFSFFYCFSLLDSLLIKVEVLTLYCCSSIPPNFASSFRMFLACLFFCCYAWEDLSGVSDDFCFLISGRTGELTVCSIWSISVPNVDSTLHE